MNVIEVNNIVKRYGGRPAVDGISLSVEEGEILPSSARTAPARPRQSSPSRAYGYRTWARSPSSVSIPGATGTRSVDRSASSFRRVELPDQIKVWEALDLYASFYDEPANWEQLLKDLGLTEKRNTRFKQLSGGQKQRLSIALALVGDPRIAILDELTTGLDPQARRDTWELIGEIRDRGVTVVLVTHFMEEAERLADRIAVIDAGKVVALDTPADIVRWWTSTSDSVSALGPVRRDHPGRPSGSPQRESQRSQPGRDGHRQLHRRRDGGPCAHQFVANELRIEQADLDDAFVALTGRGSDIEPTGDEA